MISLFPTPLGSLFRRESKQVSSVGSNVDPVARQRRCGANSPNKLYGRTFQFHRHTSKSPKAERNRRRVDVLFSLPPYLSAETERKLQYSDDQVGVAQPILVVRALEDEQEET